MNGKKLVSLLVVSLLILTMVQMALAGAVRNEKEFQLKHSETTEKFISKVKILSKVGNL